MMNKLKYFFILIICGILLVGCGKGKNGSVENKSSDTASSKIISADTVHNFETYESPEGKLDDEGIYRYSFLKNNDSVYDAMSYLDIDQILPVHNQKKINVTLGTNFVIDSYHFNLPNTVRKIWETVEGEEMEGNDGAMTEIDNGKTATPFESISSKNRKNSTTFFISANVINTNRRSAQAVDSDINILTFQYKGSVNSAIKPNENAGNRLSYEGINLGITRNQFLDNVKIKNPIYKDEYFRYDREYDKNDTRCFISYILDEREENDRPSYVEFTFDNEILTQINIHCTNEYLGIEVQ